MLLLLLAGLAMFQKPTPSSVLDSNEWVVRDILPPTPEFVYGDRVWRDISLFGDLDGDGMSEFAATVWDYPPMPIGSHWVDDAWRGYCLFGHAGDHRRLICWEWAPFSNQVVQRGREMAILNASPGLLLGLATAPNWEFSLRPPHDFMNPIVSGAPVGLEHLRFPDIDGDGWDEIVRHRHRGPYLIGETVLLDGATLSEKWRYSDQPLSGENLFYPASVTPWPDLNGDQSPDVISSWGVWYGASGMRGMVAALDGQTGQLIWRYEHPIAPAIIPCADCPDVTGDGITDIVFSIPGPIDGEVVMLDGASGNIVWHQRVGNILLPNLLPRFRYHGLDYALIPTKAPGPGDQTVLLLDIVLDNLPPWLDWEWRWIHLDARTGEFLGFARRPPNLKPWFIDHLAEGPMRIGDWDRDGLTEAVVRASLWSLDLPDVPQAVPTTFVVLGLRTLHVPAFTNPGDSFEAEVSIPSAPHHDFTVLASLGFDRDGGQLLDGWRTMLAPDAVFAATRGGRFSGRLDADGVGSTTVTLPALPALGGKTIYTKAVVWKPGSTTEVWTLSSLGQTEIR